MVVEAQQPLIPGLPDDNALDCLARVPLRFHAGLRRVCRRWRDLITARDFRRHREHVGASEDLVFLVQALAADVPASGEPKEAEEDKNASAKKLRAPAHGLSVYNATRGEWARVAAPEPVPMFAQCAAAGGSVAVAGGWDPATFAPVRDVRVLDPATGEWRAGRPVPAPVRSLFACAAAGGRVYAAGGHDGQKNALRSAVAYDPAADRWEEMPAMAEERDECRGVALGGKFLALSGYGTEQQGRFGASAECYDPVSNEWRKDESIWGEEEQANGGAAACFAVDGKLYYIDCGEGGRRGVREWESGGWRRMASVPEGMKPGAYAAPLSGERVFVMAAEGGGRHAGWVFDIKTKRWSRVGMPPGFSGFVYSAAAIRL